MWLFVTFTEHSIFKIHPCPGICQDSVPFDDRMLLHNSLHSLRPFIADGCSRFGAVARGRCCEHLGKVFAKQVRLSLAETPGVAPLGRTVTLFNALRNGGCAGLCSHQQCTGFRCPHVLTHTPYPMSVVSVIASLLGTKHISLCREVSEN